MARKKESELAKAEKAFQIEVNECQTGALITAFVGLQTALKAEVKRGEVSAVESLARLSNYAVSAAEAAADVGDFAIAGEFQTRQQSFDAARELLDADANADAPTDTSQKNVGQAKSHVI